MFMLVNAYLKKASWKTSSGAVDRSYLLHHFGNQTLTFATSASPERS